MQTTQGKSCDKTISPITAPAQFTPQKQQLLECLFVKAEREEFIPNLRLS
jgi:hypothetical protein